MNFELGNTVYQKMRSSILPPGPGGKNQKNNWSMGKAKPEFPVMFHNSHTFLVSFLAPLIGIRPDHDGPTSKLTNGRVAPFT
jgi:hypothetical protein